jgi:hypothetical protein
MGALVPIPVEVRKITVGALASVPVGVGGATVGALDPVPVGDRGVTRCVCRLESILLVGSRLGVPVARCDYHCLFREPNPLGST